MTSRHLHPDKRRHGAVALLLGAAFAGVAAAVATGRAQQPDGALRRRHPRPRRGALHAFGEGVKSVAQPPIQLPLAAVTAYALWRARIPGARTVLAAAAGTFVLDKACKRVIRRQRPPRYQGNEEDQSFPSGHTASIAALTLTVASLLRQAGAASGPGVGLGAGALIALVAETRLLLDEHWPSDVLGGALLGSAAAYGALALVRPRRRPRNVSRARD